MLEVWDTRSRKVYIWNGSHTVNVYAESGENIDVFTFGFNANGDTPTEQDFLSALGRHLS